MIDWVAVVVFAGMAVLLFTYDENAGAQLVELWRKFSRKLRRK